MPERSRVVVFCGFLLMLFFLCVSVKAQNLKNKFDSLQYNLKSAKTDTVQIRIYNELGNYFQLSNPDSAIFFFSKSIGLARSIKFHKSNFNYSILFAEALQKSGWANCVYKTNYDSCIAFSTQALNISSELAKSDDEYRKARAEKNISDCYNNIGRVSTEKGAYDEAIEYYNKALVIIEKQNNKNGMHLCFFNIGNVYYYQGFFDKAIEYYQKALAVDEKINNKPGISSCYNNIGNVHLSQKNFEKAIEYYQKSLEIDESLGNKNGMSYCYGNIGLVYQSKGNYKLAIKYVEKQLKINEELDDKKGMGNCYTNLGNIYQNLHEYQKAITYLEKSLKISEEIDDKYSKALVLTNIALVKIEMTDDKQMNTYKKNILYNESINFGMQAYNLSGEIKSLTMKNEAAWILFRAFKALNMKEKAIEFIEYYVQTKDSMFQEDKTNAIEEMEAKYQTEKKQLAIGKLEKEKELQTSEMKKQKIINLFVICGLLFVIGFTVILFRMFVQKKKANIIILSKNNELEQANEEIRVQRDVVTNQKEHIEHIHEELTDSIVYAKRIQQAVMPMDDYLQKFLQEYFIFSKPKDIVSGDFFWITKVKSWTLFCVADCTGHGVPGAFMSMLGIALLNEIVRQEEIKTASQVLDQLRNRIIEALNQKGISGEQQDGMDLAFCALNLETLEMQFAGANNPCYVIANTQPVIAMRCPEPVEGVQPEAISITQSDCFVPRNDDCQLIEPVSELVELKGDKMPIGIHREMRPFTNQCKTLYKGDMIYLLSDGYEDQFGGSNQKKFLSKNLKDLLIANSQKSMADQKQVLETTILDWMIGYEQIDDITILGIRI